MIPLNVKTCTFKIKDNKHIYVKKQEYFNKLLEYKLNEHDFKFNVKKGQTFINKKTNEIVYYIEYAQSCNKIEIAPIDHIHMKKKRKDGKLEGGQIFKNINSFFDNYEICDTDVLGNIFKRNNV